MTFYLLWCNVISWNSYIQKKSSFPSFYSFLVKFNEERHGSVTVKLTKCDKYLNWVKNAIMQVTYFLNGSMFNLLFFFIFFYTERKWLLIRNLAAILPLKSKLSGKRPRFIAIDRSIKMLKNIWIFKNFK